MPHKKEIRFTGISSTNKLHDVLDPIVSRANEPPTPDQIHLARTIGVDLTGKNPGSARIAIAIRIREWARSLTLEHKLVPGMRCLLDGKTEVTIKQVGGASEFHTDRGSIVLISTPNSHPKAKWVHPRWLSDFKTPEE